MMNVISRTRALDSFFHHNSRVVLINFIRVIIIIRSFYHIMVNIHSVISILFRYFVILFMVYCLFLNNKFLRLEKELEKEKKNLPSFSHGRCFNHSRPSTLRFVIYVSIRTIFRNYGSFSTLIANCVSIMRLAPTEFTVLVSSISEGIPFETLIIFFCNFSVRIKTDTGDIDKRR